MFWYRKAAEQNDTEAQHFLGNMFLTFRNDKRQADYWHKKAVENGKLFSLGNDYHFSWNGKPKNDL